MGIPGTTSAAGAPARTVDLSEHLPWVDHLVRRWAARVPAHVDLDDLRSVAREAALRAVREWDPDGGVPLRAWLRARVGWALTDAARAADWFPRRLRSDHRRVCGARDRLRVTLGREPADAEVAAHLGWSPERVREVTGSAARMVTSLEGSGAEPVCDGDSGSGDPVGDAVVDRMLLDSLWDRVGRLDERTRFVFIARYLWAWDHSEIAGLLGVSRSRVSQLHAEGLRELRAGVLDEPEEVTAL